MDIEKFKELTQEDIDEIYEGREDVAEKNKHLAAKDLLHIAVNFSESQARVSSEFSGIRGFTFRDGKIVFIVDESVDEEEKEKIRKSMVGFTDFNKVVASIIE